MKNLAHHDLATRKLILQQRCAIQRQVLAIQIQRTVSPAVQAYERVRAGGQWVQKHPALVAGAAALLLIWRPRAIVGLAGRSLGLWQTWRRVLPIATRLWGLLNQPPRS